MASSLGHSENPCLEVRIAMALVRIDRYISHPWSTNRVWTLILKPTGDAQGTYRRIGQGEVHERPDSSWFYKSLTIV
jgi:hypothetical protein